MPLIMSIIILRILLVLILNGLSLDLPITRNIVQIALILFILYVFSDRNTTFCVYFWYFWPTWFKIYIIYLYFRLFLDNLLIFLQFESVKSSEFLVFLTDLVHTK